MQFLTCASMFLLGIFLPNAVGAAATPVDADTVARAVAATCLSGLDHNLGTSCHTNVGSFACSGNDRAYILQCQSDSIWAVYSDCPSGTGCHNCGCAPGY